MKHQQFKSIFISDIHLGSKACKAEETCAFLKTHKAENLFLVGDIIDGWRLRKKWFFPQSHVNVIRRILTFAKRETNVFYILGNHDEVFRKFLHYGIDIGRIQILNEYTYTSNGRKYLIIHGDSFDTIMLDQKWLMHIGDTLYNLLIWFNNKFNKVRKLFGMNYWSLSKWLKHNTKEALNFIYRFEEKIISYCKEENYDGIVCGHIHTPNIKKIDDVVYMNDGDFCESCSAIVETFNGDFFILALENGYFVPVQANVLHKSDVLHGEECLEYYKSLGYQLQNIGSENEEDIDYN